MNNNNAQWSQTASGVVANGVCNSGYSGSPTRLCSLGIFGTVSNPCNRNFFVIFLFFLSSHSFILIFTFPISYFFLILLARFLIFLSCFRIANPCSSVNDNNAQWSQTSSGIVSNGVCNSGYSGNPTRLCSFGIFRTVSNPCTRNIIFLLSYSFISFFKILCS